MVVVTFLGTISQYVLASDADSNMPFHVSHFHGDQYKEKGSSNTLTTFSSTFFSFEWVNYNNFKEIEQHFRL